MYSISEVAKLTSLTARALRHYEEKGLIKCSRRAHSGYRYYSAEIISKIEEIKKYKRMNFSLEEIKEFLEVDENLLENSLKSKLSQKLLHVDKELSKLLANREEIETQLSATDDFLKGEVLKKGQRRVFMEALRGEILEQLKLKKDVTRRDLEYLKREDFLFDTKEKREFIDAVKKCLKFAEKEGIKLGSARGAAPALLSLYAIGWNHFDPSEYGLIPERFNITNFDLHIDVEFEKGKKFIDYCKGVSSRLALGKIEAFKLPIIDIIERANTRLNYSIDYDSIGYNDPLILDLFRKGDIERIFSFDIPENTLLAKHFDSHYYKDGSATKMLSDYLKSQPIYDFKDLLNIEAIFRPDSLDKKPFMREYIDRYPKAKKDGYSYECLSASLNEYLKPNYGVIIYQEDIIHIINHYTSWNYQRCNEFRVDLSNQDISDDQKDEFLQYASREVLDLLMREASVAFCKAHSVGAWPELIKKTAILKALHKDIYFEEIEKWEEEHSYSWGDFGFISGGLSLLQQ